MRNNTKTAYLVAWIDVQRFEVVQVAIYSERYPTPPKQHKWQPAVLAEDHARDFETAVKCLCDRIAQDNTRCVGPRDIGWVLKYLPDGTLKRVRDATCPHCSQPLVQEEK